MKYVSPYFSKGQKIEYDSKRRSYRSNHNGIFNSYTPEGTPLEMEIDTYNIVDYCILQDKLNYLIEFTDGTRDYYTNIEVIDIKAKPKFYGLYIYILMVGENQI